MRHISAADVLVEASPFSNVSVAALLATSGVVVLEASALGAPDVAAGATSLFAGAWVGVAEADEVETGVMVAPEESVWASRKSSRAPLYTSRGGPT